MNQTNEASDSTSTTGMQILSAQLVITSDAVWASCNDYRKGFENFFLTRNQKLNILSRVKLFRVSFRARENYNQHSLIHQGDHLLPHLMTWLILTEWRNQTGIYTLHSSSLKPSDVYKLFNVSCIIFEHFEDIEVLGSFTQSEAIKQWKGEITHSNS